MYQSKLFRTPNIECLLLHLNSHSNLDDLFSCDFFQRKVWTVNDKYTPMKYIKMLTNLIFSQYLNNFENFEKVTTTLNCLQKIHQSLEQKATYILTHAPKKQCSSSYQRSDLDKAVTQKILKFKWQSKVQVAIISNQMMLPFLLFQQLILPKHLILFAKIMNSFSIEFSQFPEQFQNSINQFNIEQQRINGLGPFKLTVQQSLNTQEIFHIAIKFNSIMNYYISCLKLFVKDYQGI
ncbi:unnamed protein product [Paramecium sonneborni]|uniref:Uncharacterized protein n=1 Tax=Paramecium sonneborni TaxID=65129 RepID=A0A8S1RWT0_9CILI|nr:unnamed protein product [Paramecium sonneborni]